MIRQPTLAVAALVWALVSSVAGSTRAEEGEAAAAVDMGGFYDSEAQVEVDDQAAEAPLLDLYGFVDFTYTKNLAGADSVYSKFPRFGSFAVGNINLYAASNLGKGWRSLLEVRLLYLPNGVSGPLDFSGSVDRTDTSVPDYADFERQLDWGGVELERVFLEYEAAPWLAVQFGQYLTPYGIWNIDHGTPTIIPVRRPFVIGEVLFPERQTGIEVHGAVHSGQTSLGYHATISNGRGPLDTYRDLDDNTAVGGRLYIRSTSLGRLVVGVSGYYGLSTDRNTGYGLREGSAPPQLEIKDSIRVQYEELALGADARWEWQELVVQGELLANQRVFVDPYRRVDVTGPLADTIRLGGYALVGYRTPWLGIMPYTLAEHYNFQGNALFPPATTTITGVNVRPQSNVVFKLQYQYSQMGKVSSSELLRGTVHQADAQVAWAF